MPERVTTAFRVRAMTTEDIPQVMAIDAASFAMPWPEHAYQFEVERNKVSFAFVAEEPENGRIVGMAVVWLLLDEVHIATIGVHPAWRRRGVGRLLLASALLKSLRYGAETATLEVRVSNEAAQALYRQFGFKIAGRRPRYYNDNNEDALLMTAYSLDEAFLRRQVAGSLTETIVNAGDADAR